MFCPDCGSWNRSALRACARCTHPLPELRGPSEVPDALVTALRHALGVMMYECLAGQPPFDGPDARFQRGHDLADALTPWLAAVGATPGARAARPGG